MNHGAHLLRKTTQQSTRTEGWKHALPKTASEKTVRTMRSHLDDTQSVGVGWGQ